MRIATLFALGATASAMAFNGPSSTQAIVDKRADNHGWTPKPTSAPQPLPKLSRRQGNDNGMCGYIQGDAQFPISCTVGSCFQATSLSWFGCCSGAAPDSCNIATRCVASASVESCLSDSACYDDQYVTACTDAAAPLCAKLYSTMGQQQVSHWVCVATATSVEVVPTTTGGASSAVLKAASANSVMSSPVSSAAGSSSAVESSNSGKMSSTVSATGARSSTVSRSSTSGQSASVGINAAATSSRSTAGAAIQTARAVAGAAAGGLVGVLALLF